MADNTNNMINELHSWVNKAAENGIKQHSQEWHIAKSTTIGGSSIAVIEGSDPYSSVSSLISSKIGYSKFMSNLYMQWGNLMEDVIKRCVEYEQSCEILGEDLYIDGGDQYPGAAYSPDGITIMNINSMPTKILCEFKCPFSRLPNGKPPKNYVSQVKMGMEMCDIDIAVLIEGVYRRCSWEVLGPCPTYCPLVSPKSKGDIRAYGIIGLYLNPIYSTIVSKYDPGESVFSDVNSDDIDNNDQQELTKETVKIPLDDIKFIKYLKRVYTDHYVEIGDHTNEYLCNDLGESPVDLFKLIMKAYDKKILQPWYGNIEHNMTANNKLINDDLARFNEHCASNKFINFGILPWKLFQLDYHYIQREHNYLSNLMPKLQEILEVVKNCNNPDNIAAKHDIYTSYTNPGNETSFVDS